MADFTEVHDTRTGLKQRVPTVWLDDPILGRFIKKTPSQRALDGELGQAPTEDSTVPQIRKFAEAAEIDITGLAKKDELLAAVRAVVGTDPLPVGVDASGVAVQPDPVGADVETPAGEPTPDTDSASAEPENPDTPAAGDEEN
jgi:hypothetical protein